MDTQQKISLDELLNHDFPSRIFTDPWVYADNLQVAEYRSKFKEANPGKWLIFVPLGDIDSTWKKIKKATQDGVLGQSSKAATSYKNPNTSTQTEKVICINTFNHNDAVDVFRIRDEIRQLGIDSTMYYKTSEATSKGFYRVRGDKEISKYISPATNVVFSDLSSLHGVGVNLSRKLDALDIVKIDDLLNFDSTNYSMTNGISKDLIKRLKLKAISLIDNKIFKISSFEVFDKNVIFYDVETNLAASHISKKVWSITLYHNTRIKKFIAYSWEEEQDILKKFITYLKKHDFPILYSYSGFHFDRIVIMSALKRFNLDYEYFEKCIHRDLQMLINRNYILPLKSYGLKEIGKLLGYKFKNQGLDGIYAAMTYGRCQEEGKRLPKELIDYIEDDVKVMHYIIKQLLRRKDILYLD